MSERKRERLRLLGNLYDSAGEIRDKALTLQLSVDLNRESGQPQRFADALDNLNEAVSRYGSAFVDLRNFLAIDTGGEDDPEDRR